MGERFLSASIIQFPFLINIMSFYFNELSHALIVGPSCFYFILPPDLCDIVQNRGKSFEIISQRKSNNARAEALK